MRLFRNLSFFLLSLVFSIFSMELSSQVKLLSLKELAARKALKEMSLDKLFELNMSFELKKYLLSLDDKLSKEYERDVIKRIIWNKKDRAFISFVNEDS